MRNLKRALSLTLASVMLLGMMVVGAGAASYPDVDESNNIEAIEVLQAVKVMEGDSAGNFDPDRPVSRAEMAVIMALLLNLDYDYYRGTKTFNDVPNWCAPYVAACYANGIISGYNATTYGSADTVNAVQAASMMMRALGYFKFSSDYEGDFVLSTVKQASKIELFKGINANSMDPLTRNQVAQLALNALKTPIVEPEDNTLTIKDANGNIIATGGQVNYVVTASRQPYAYAIGKSETSGTGLNKVSGGIIELGEKLYSGELKLNDDRGNVDDFGRPSRTWEYKGQEVGTYAKKEELRAEYTEKVTGKAIYDLLGSGTVNNKDYNLTVTIDGNTNTDPAIFGKNALTRTNTDAIGATGNGVLTQVYVDTENKDIYIAVINTYLAIAENDYNAKKDEVSLKIYDLKKDGKVYYKDSEKVSEPPLKASGDDFVIEDVKKDDKFLVTVAAGEIKSLAEPEILSGETITSHKVDKYVVADKQYDYATTAQYDVDVMESFGSDDLKEVTYNIVLDKYGYLIGVEKTGKVDQYVFLTGVDSGYSKLSQKNVPANVIFMDGSMKTVTINAKKSVLEYSTTGGNNPDVVADDEARGNGSQANMWCTYSVDSDGIYTLKAVPGETRAKAAGVEAIKVAQSSQDAINAKGNPTEINSKNISLNGDGSNRVHGNDETVYINTTLANVKVDNATFSRIVDDVDTVTTGVAKVDMTVKDLADVTENGNKFEAPSHEIFTLYNDKGVILGVVTLDAEDNATVTHYAYINSDKIDHRDYDASAKEYSFYREAIVDGEFVMLKEVSDSAVSDYLDTDSLVQGKWYEIKYNADNEVKGYLEVTYAAGETDNATYDENDVPTGTKNATETNVGIHYMRNANYVANEFDKTFILNAAFAAENHVELKFNKGTLYTGNDADKGVYVAADAKVVVFIKDYDSYEEYAGSSMETALNYLVDKKNFNGYVNAVIGDDGIADVVIIDEKTEDVDEPELNGDIKIISTNTGNNINTSGKILYTIENSTTDVPSLKELQAALVAQLSKEGYSDFKWNGNTLNYVDNNGVSGSTPNAVAASNFEWVYKMTLKNKTDNDKIYYVKYVADTAAEDSTWTGGTVYTVSSANAVATVASVNLDTTPYNNDNGTGVVSNIADDGTRAYANTYNGIGTTGAIAPKATHDFTVETGYVKVINVDGEGATGFAKYKADYTIPANSVTNSKNGSIYEWAVASGDSGVQEISSALTIEASKVVNDITITADKVRVTGDGITTMTTHNPSGDYTLPAKPTGAEGLGFKWTSGTKNGYGVYGTGKITAANIEGDIVLAAGYKGVTFTLTNGTDEDGFLAAFDVKYQVGSAAPTAEKPICAKVGEDVKVIITAKEEIDLEGTGNGSIATSSTTSDAASIADDSVKDATSDDTKIVFKKDAGTKLATTNTITFTWDASATAITPTLTYTAPTT